jgi:ABC-2 type transport system permease protein
MNKIWLIIKREYLVRVKKKSFIIMTFLGPILFAAVMFGAIALALNDNTSYDVLICDEAGIITKTNEAGSALESRFQVFKDSDNIHYHFTPETLTPDVFKESPYNVMIQVDQGTINDGHCNFYFKKVPSEFATQKIKSEMEESLERFRVTDSLRMDYEAYKRVKMDVSFHEINIEKLGTEDKTKETAVVGFGFAIMIYLFIFLYGVQVMRGVIEEKTNRIVEVIVSSVKPFQLMMGKVIGIGLVGLTQFFMWVLLSGVVSTIGMFIFQSQFASGASMIENHEMVQTGMSQAEAMQKLMDNEAIGLFFRINWPLMIGLFVFYFIGGYLLYGSLFAAIGAAVDSETDTQQFMAPVTVPLIFGYVVSAMMINNPEGAAGTFFSIFPLTSPITMMVKTAIGTDTWLIVVSMLVLIVTFVAMIWVAGRIYRVGILMYGKKPTYRELLKWIRYQ